MAQLVKHPNFGSGHDLMVCEFEAHVGLYADSSEPGECFGFCVCVSFSLCLSSTHTLSLSLSLPFKSKSTLKFFFFF